jgi:hypothetical protein
MCWIVYAVLRLAFLETVRSDRDDNELFLYTNDEDNDFNFIDF